MIDGAIYDRRETEYILDETNVLALTQLHGLPIIGLSSVTLFKHRFEHDKQSNDSILVYPPLE
jgi:hypothetical protein